MRIEKGARRACDRRGLRRPHAPARGTSRRPRSSSSPPTASARRACCWRRTTSPTARTRSAAISCTTRWSPARCGSTSRCTRTWATSAALIGREFAETDVSRGFVNGFNFNCVTTGGAGEQAIGFVTPASRALGRGPPPVVRAAISAMASACSRSATTCRSRQPGHAVRHARGTRTACRSPKLHYAPRENDLTHDALHARPAGGDRQGGRCLRVPAAGLYRRGRRLPHAGLAPARHLPDGQDPGDVGGQQAGTSAGTCPTSTSSTAACSPPAAWSTRRPRSARWRCAPPSICATTSPTCGVPQSQRRADRHAQPKGSPP